jgi:hypothetical protein
MNTSEETQRDASLEPSVYGAAPSLPPPSYERSRVSFPLEARPSIYPPYSSPTGQLQAPYKNVMIHSGYISVQTASVRDYMTWSIVNIFLGGIVLGLVAVLLSTQTRMRKGAGDLRGARRMSKITLILNVFSTLISFAASAFLIVYLVYFISDPN